MALIDYYQKLVKSGKIIDDPRQHSIIEKLQTIQEHLKQNKGRLHKFKSLFQKKTPVKGIYLWGNVGIGKTFLMDIFYENLPFDDKLRIHFHQFMQKVHHQLSELQGEKNPLQKIAHKFAKKISIICFDELSVTNIVDAMLLAQLFKSMINEGICLLFTSNVAPDDLYKNGLQRQQFLPAIKLIKQHTEVVNLKAEYDYRMTHEFENNFFWTPINEETKRKMEHAFLMFSEGAAIVKEPMLIHNRFTKVIKRANGVIWFDFMELCGIPRSQEDYLSLIENYHTFFISNLKMILPYQHDLAESFIKLIDVLYDAKIRIVISSEVSIHNLYPEGKLIKTFARTKSRLTEMQSGI